MLPLEIDECPLGDEYTVYIDEVGRGCLAGDVTVAAVIWPRSFDQCSEDNKFLGLIKDSKKLSERQRGKLQEFIKRNAIEYAIHSIDNHTIDRVNILNATYMAMHGALDKLNTSFNRIVVDGNQFKPYKTVRHVCVVGGDNRLLQIAAASILAKTDRDERMIRIAKDYNPSYGWSSNKGYGTKSHIDAIVKHGPTDLHRLTFLTKILGVPSDPEAKRVALSQSPELQDY